MSVLSSASYEQLLLGLRVYHYRLHPQGESKFRDVYYDTGDWDLYQRGYSFRFRTRIQGSGGSRYAVRLVQEPRFVAPDSMLLDRVADLPESLGAAIEAGAWEQAVLAATGVAAVQRLHALLQQLELSPGSLRPQLVAELGRERFDVSDKGRNWFELDHEAWTFRRFDSSVDAHAVGFEDVVVDTRLGAKDREFYRRGRTMRAFLDMLDGIERQDRAPHERAIAAWVRQHEAAAPGPPAQPRVGGTRP